MPVNGLSVAGSVWYAPHPNRVGQSIFFWLRFEAKKIPIFTKVDFMKTRLAKRPVFWLLALCGILLMAESCKTSRNCGCGSDILGNYKPSKRHRY
jgi:hypothetical protein